MVKKYKLGSFSKFTGDKFSRLQIAALEAAANSIVITDAKGHIIWANSAFTTLTGYRLSEVFNQNPRFLKSGVHPSEFYKELWDTITANQVWHGEMVNKKKDGTFFQKK